MVATLIWDHHLKNALYTLPLVYHAFCFFKLRPLLKKLLRSIWPFLCNQILPFLWYWLAAECSKNRTPARLSQARWMGETFFFLTHKSFWNAVFLMLEIDRWNKKEFTWNKMNLRIAFIRKKLIKKLKNWTKSKLPLTLAQHCLKTC